MEDFSPVGLALSSIAPIYRSISGFMQTRKGNKILDNLTAPTYTTPEEVNKNLSLARNQFMNTRLPGQDVAENKLEGNTAQAIKLAGMYGKAPSDVIAAIVGANSNENAGFNDLATQASQRQQQDLANYQGALQLGADYKDKEFAYNKWMPYMNQRQYGENLVGAGNKNLYGGLGDLASGAVLSGASGAADTGLNSLYSKMFGKKTPITTSDSGLTAQNLTGNGEFNPVANKQNPYQWNPFSTNNYSTN